MTHARVRTHTLLVIAVLCTATGMATAQVGIGAAQFDERRQTLNDLAARKLTLPPAELVEVLSTALDDPDPDIRQRGLWAVTGRAGVLRFANTDDNRAVWRSERPGLASLRPKVTESLNHPELKVRLAAIAAIGNLDFEPGGSRMNAVSITPSTAQLLGRRYAIEPSPLARSELVKAFALLTAERTRGFERESLTIITAALSDKSADVVQVAALGVGNLKFTPLLKEVVTLLRSESKGVRLAAAQTIASFGPQAAQYAGTVDEAMEKEADPVVRNTLERVSQRLRGGD